MKKYTIQEVERKIEELDKESEDIERKIEELRDKWGKLGILDRKAKKSIDQDIKTHAKMAGCCHHAKLMFLLYEDSISSEGSGLSDEELIQLERKAEAGDGVSKLMSFCHRCFIDKAITSRDIKRLEMEANEGDMTSFYILWGYKTFFEE